MKSPRHIKYVFTSILAILFFGLLFQNCSDISVRPLLSNSEIPTPPNGNDSDEDTDSGNDDDAPDAFCGNYDFTVATQSITTPSNYTYEVKTFELHESQNPEQAIPGTWSSSFDPNAITSNGGATYQASLYSIETCSLQSVSVQFLDLCGQPKTLNNFVSLSSCPSPPPENATCDQRNKPPGLMVEDFGFARTGNIGAFSSNQDVRTLAKFLNKTTEDIFPEGPRWGGHVKGRYWSLSFKTPDSTNPYVLKFMTAQTASFLVSISDCPGDFYISANAKGCMITATTETTLTAFVNSTQFLSDCHLEPGKTYYLNITAHMPNNGWSFAYSDDPSTPEDESASMATQLLTAIKENTTH